MNAEAAQGRILGNAAKEIEAAAEKEASDAGKADEKQKGEGEEDIVSGNPAQVQQETAMAGYKPVDVLL